MHLIHRQTCRVCNSNSLTPVIDLGEQFLQGSFVKPGKELPPNRKIKCELVRCNPELDETACGLLQMKHTVPPTVLYRAYWYRSGTNDTMRNHLRGIAESAIESQTRSETRSEALRVLDIGCNDGTLLRNYPAAWTKYGVDPSDVAKEVAGENLKVVQDVFPSRELEEIIGGEKLDVVTSIAMFYDLENPVEFAGQIKSLLSPDGVWIFEMSYMPAMLRLNSYDTICHEHLEYYSLAVIENILRRVDLRLFKIEFNEINGGSVRCLATHANNKKHDNAENQEFINQIRQQEFDLLLDTDKPYLEFQQRIDREKEKLRALLIELKQSGKRTHIYGASTKGNTILQFCRIDKDLIECASERNPDKFGARTLGTDIPIVSEAESRQARPDYYLVLPWHFKAEFIEREREMLDKGVGFIFPLPTIEIVKK